MQLHVLPLVAATVHMLSNVHGRRWCARADGPVVGSHRSIPLQVAGRGAACLTSPCMSEIHSVATVLYPCVAS